MSSMRPSWRLLRSGPATEAGPFEAYRSDLRRFFQWAADTGLEVLKATRPQIELYVRALEGRGFAATTIDRRLSTVCGYYRFAHIDGRIPSNPAQYVRRPKIHPSGARGLDRGELGAFLFTAERFDRAHAALAALLGLNGLRVSEACSTNIENLGSERGHALSGSSGRATSRPSSPLFPARHARSTWRSVSGLRVRSFSVETGSGLTGARRTGGCARSASGPAWSRFTRTCCGPGSSCARSMPACRCGRSSSRPATRIPEQPPFTTTAGRTSTSTPPTSSSPSSPAADGQPALSGEISLQTSGCSRPRAPSGGRCSVVRRRLRRRRSDAAVERANPGFVSVRSRQTG